MQGLDINPAKKEACGAIFIITPVHKKGNRPSAHKAERTVAADFFGCYLSLDCEV